MPAHSSFFQHLPSFRTSVLKRSSFDTTRATLLCLPLAKSNVYLLNDQKLREQITQNTQYLYIVAQTETGPCDWGYILTEQIGTSWDPVRKMYTVNQADCISVLPPLITADPSFTGYKDLGVLPPFERWMYQRIELYTYLRPRPHLYQVPPELQYLLTLDTPEAVQKDLATYNYTAIVLEGTYTDWWLKCEERISVYRHITCLLQAPQTTYEAGSVIRGVSLPRHITKHITGFCERFCARPIEPRTESEAPVLSRLDKVIQLLPPCMSSLKETLDMEEIIPMKQKSAMFDVLMYLEVPVGDLDAAIRTSHPSKKTLLTTYARNNYIYQLHKKSREARTCSGCPAFMKQQLCPYGELNADMDEAKKIKIAKAAKAKCIIELEAKDFIIKSVDLSPLVYTRLSLN